MLKLHSLSKMRLREVYNIVKGFFELILINSFSMLSMEVSEVIDLNIFKLRCNTNKRLVFFSQRVINEWNNLSESEAESVNVF